MGFAASGGNATRQLAAVRGVGPRRVSSWRQRHRRDPRGLAPPWGTGMRRRSRQTQRPASEPPGPTVAADDAPTSCLGDKGTASLPMGALNSDMLCAPRAPRSRPPHSHRDRRRDADKSARGQPRHAATSPAARSISAHFHWRKSVPHPVTEYTAGNSAAVPQPTGAAWHAWALPACTRPRILFWGALQATTPDLEPHGLF